jgi:hypothetical protein
MFIRPGPKEPERVTDDRVPGAPSFALFAKGRIAEYAGEGFRGQSSGIPPFAKSAKDEAPDQLWQSKR